MQTYFYTAIGAIGEKVTGTESAEDERQLASILRGKGYLLTTATTEKAKKQFFSLKSLSRRFRSVSLTDKLLFCRNLEVMVAAGIPLPKALDVLSVQARNASFRTILLDVKKKVVEGQSLSAAMHAYPAVFSDLFTNMIKVGEESGTLEEVLRQLTLQLHHAHELRSRVFGALMYPAVVVVAMIGVGTLMLIAVVPKLADTFRDLGVPLPFTTRIVIAFGTLLAQYWYVIFPVLFVLMIFALRFIRTKRGKRAFDAVLLRMPLFGGIVRKMNAALMTRTLSSLIASGVPIVRALEITSQVVGNIYFQDSIQVCAQKVGKGGKLSQALGEYKHLYPAVVVQMVEVGEETGETGHILEKLAEFYEEEVGQITKNLTSIIEPILMLVVGVMVGFFAISMIQPMYGMLNSLQ